MPEMLNLWELKFVKSVNSDFKSPLSCSLPSRPRPLWSHGSDSGLVGESLRDPRVHIQSKTEVFWISKKKTSLTCCLCVQMCHSGICPHLSGQGKIRAAFTLRCPLIGGQQPSSTVMLDLWMKPPPPLPHCKKKKKKLHIWLQKNILLLLFNTY